MFSASDPRVRHLQLGDYGKKAYSMTMESPDPYQDALSDVVTANRILALEGILDAFVHCSARDPRDPHRYLMSRSLAPALVTTDDIILHDLDNNALTHKDQRLYYERWIHGEI